MIHVLVPRPRTQNPGQLSTQKRQVGAPFHSGIDVHCRPLEATWKGQTRAEQLPVEDHLTGAFYVEWLDGLLGVAGMMTLRM